MKKLSICFAVPLLSFLLSMSPDVGHPSAPQLSASLTLSSRSSLNDLNNSRKANLGGSSKSPIEPSVIADSATIKYSPPLEFSWFIDYDWFSPPNAWGADPVSKWIKENKNVDITWMNPNGTSGNKLNLMVATGELPDVMCLPRDARVSKLIDAGLLIPIDSYLDEMPNLKKWAGTNLDLLRYKDGKLYTFPNWYINPDEATGNGKCGWGINTKIYQALGSPKIVTFDDLEAYLVRVKAVYPDVTPLETGEGFQAGRLVFRGMDEHLADYMDKWLGTPIDGKFTKVFKDPHVRDTVLFFNHLLRNNLMNPDAFTETYDQVVEKLVSGKVAIFASYDFPNSIDEANNNNKVDKALFDVLWPPVRKGVDPSKVTLSGFTTVGWNVNVFARNSESKLRRILRYLDWATGAEGQAVICYGPKGYFWDIKDKNEVPIWNDKYRNATQKERKESRIFYWDWVGNTTWVDIANVVTNERLPPEHRNPKARMLSDVIFKTSWNENQFEYDQPDPASDLGIINTQIGDIYEEARTKAIMAQSDDEALKILDDAQTAMDNAGYDQILEFNSTEWAKRIALLAKLNHTRGIAP